MKKEIIGDGLKLPEILKKLDFEHLIDRYPGSKSTLPCVAMYCVAHGYCIAL